MITDERLKELIDISEGRKELEKTPIDIEKYRMAQELLSLRKENDRMKDTTYCAYCGEEFPLYNNGDPDAVGEHIRTCPKHPMRALEEECQAWREDAENLYPIAKIFIEEYLVPQGCARGCTAICDHESLIEQYKKAE